jgi:putative N-acetylmannosamine-6-phosphate epimerase
MANVTIKTPNAIFCPKCGQPLELSSIDDPKTMVKLQEAGYVAGARGDCACGVTAVLAMKKMPENPTFSLLFNIYKFETTKDKMK